MDNIKGLKKLTKEQRFFVVNVLKLTKELYEKNKDYFSSITKLQDINEEEFLQLIANIMLKHDIKDNKMSISLFKQKEIIKELDEQINTLMKNEYNHEKQMLDNNLPNISKNQFNLNNYMLSLGLDFDIKKISDKDLKIIIDAKIEGKNYSERIWNNREHIAKKLKVNVRDFLNGKVDCNKIEKEIRDRFKVNKNLSKRLVQNEINRVQSESNEVWFKDNRVEYLLYSATLDRRTCSEFMSDDGKVFRSDDINRPELPRHVNDRCTYIALPNQDYRPSFRIDNENKTDISYQTYEDWANGNN